jgi:hypothetical protein
VLHDDLLLAFAPETFEFQQQCDPARHKIIFQRFPKAPGNSMQHGCDME